MKRNEAPVRVVTFTRAGGGKAKYIANSVDPGTAVAEAFAHYHAAWEVVTEVRVDGEPFHPGKGRG